MDMTDPVYKPTYLIEDLTKQIAALKTANASLSKDNLILNSKLRRLKTALAWVLVELGLMKDKELFKKFENNIYKILEGS